MKLEEIEKLCDEATPGPWYNVGESVSLDPEIGAGYHHQNHKVISTSFDDEYITNPNAYNDAKFLAMARTELPKLLAVANAGKNLDIDLLDCDEKIHEGWNTMVVLEHYATCRKCAFIKALNEFGLELEEPDVDE